MTLLGMRPVTLFYVMLVKDSKKIESVRDRVFRLGGDEFIIVSENVDEKELCEEIEHVVRRDIRVELETVNVSVSIGISVVKEGGSRDALKEADIAMYEAKKSNAQRYAFFSEEMTEGVKNKLRLMREIKMATENDEFVFYLQPKVNILTNRIYGAEALIRWNKNGKIVSPYFFIDALENSDYMYPVGKKMIEDVFNYSKKVPHYVI